MLQLKNVTKSYDAQTVVHNVSLTIEPGEFVLLTGPSGAGKSTLLHLMIGAEPPSSGSVHIDGQDLQRLRRSHLRQFRRKTGMVFQDYKLLPYQTVAENIAYPLEVVGIGSKERDRKVAKVLEQLNISHHAKNYTRSLSGGEKARVAIARAIIHDPIIVFADEPSANLDNEQRQHVFAMFRELHNQGTTVIIATHDADAAHQARILRLQDGKLTHDSKSHSSSHDAKEAKHQVLV